MNTGKIVIVDDEPDIADFIRDVADECGFETLVTNDPEHFLTLIDTSVNIAIVDLMLPKMDGVELVRELAKHNRHVAIILISGFDSAVLHSASELAKAHGLRVIGELSKPIRYDSLEAVLANYSPSPLQAQQKADVCVSPEQLAAAIENNELVTYYQPQIRLSDGRPCGVEALVRWQSPLCGLIPPNSFIPTAERYGLINPLTEIVLSQAIAQTALWKREGIELPVSINMSAKTLKSLDVTDKIMALLKQHSLDPSQIIIEVTETAVVKELVSSLETLTRLRLKGIGLSIDDFGTGYASMQQLQNIPFTELKIDRSFIDSVESNRESRAIVETIVDLASKLGLEIVAEGVEDEGTRDFLISLGCHRAQGFLWSRPLPANQLEAWLTGTFKS